MGLSPAGCFSTDAAAEGTDLAGGFSWLVAKGARY